MTQFLTVPSRIVVKENGYSFLLKNHSQKANDTNDKTKIDGVVYELIFHVHGNPIPTVQLQHPYKKEPYILIEVE